VRGTVLLLGKETMCGKEASAYLVGCKLPEAVCPLLILYFACVSEYGGISSAMGCQRVHRLGAQFGGLVVLQDQAI
jgi:hypothetical protein